MEYKDIFNQITVRYGKEEAAVGAWKKIIAIEKDDDRNKEIDKLIETMEKNSKINGFWGSSDSIDIHVFNRFVLDDKEIYYLLFKNLKEIIDLNQDDKRDVKNHMVVAINKTLDDYFGKINPNNLDKRFEITTDHEDNGSSTSIKIQKGQETAACSERSSVVHNCWLLLGEYSYWIDSKDFYMDNNSDSAHAFSILRSEKDVDGIIKTFNYIHDQSIGIWAKFENDVIEMIKKQESIFVKLKNGTKIIYTEAKKLISNHNV